MARSLFLVRHSIRLEGPRFAEISRKFSAVRWFDKTEDCIFPRSFILRSNVQSFNILPSFNLTIYLAVFSQSIAIHNLFKPSSPTFTESFLFIYPFRKYTPHCVYLRLMQLNVSHPVFMTRIIKVFPHDSLQFAGCFLLQSITITIYFGLSPNHAIMFYIVCHLILHANVLSRNHASICFIT